jgi:hypothetical protein
MGLDPAGPDATTTQSLGYLSVIRSFEYVVSVEVAAGDGEADAVKVLGLVEVCALGPAGQAQPPMMTAKARAVAFTPSERWPGRICYIDTPARCSGCLAPIDNPRGLARGAQRLATTKPVPKTIKYHAAGTYA